MSYDPLLRTARMILEGKKPDKKKDDDIEVDVKTKDGKTTEFHTKDGDGDGKVLDGSKAEKKVPSKKDDSKKSDDGDKPVNGDDDYKDDQAPKKSSSPVKDDSEDDGAEEKEVSDSEDGEESDEGEDDSKESDDELNDSKDGEGSEQKSDSEKEDEVDGSEKTKVNLKPKMKDETPGEMPVSEQTADLIEKYLRQVALAEQYEGAYVGQQADAVNRARAKHIMALEHQIAVSEFHSREWIVEHSEFGLGEILEAATYDNSFIAEMNVMFESGLEYFEYDLHELFESRVQKTFNNVMKIKNVKEKTPDQKQLKYAKFLHKNAPSSLNEPGNEHLKGLLKKHGVIKEDVNEGFAQQGTDARASAKHHEAMQAHHEEMAAHHEQEENYGLAHKHDRAVDLHQRAAYAYHDAADAFHHGKDTKAEYHMDKAERLADHAESHEHEHGIKP